MPQFLQHDPAMWTEWEPAEAAPDVIAAWVREQGVLPPVTLAQANAMRAALGVPPFAVVARPVA